MKRFSLVALLLFPALCLYAQNITISFRVNVSDELADEGMCLIKEDGGRTRTVPFSVGKTNSFELACKGKTELQFFVPGYAVLVKNIYAESDTDLGTLEFEPDINLLQGAEVSADNSHLTIENEAVSYDVSADPANRTQDLKTILTRLPFVRTDGPEKKLTVDAGNFLITVNGRRNVAMNESNLNYVTEILKGDGIKSIRINLSPTGEFSSYKAVIDVVTDKNLLGNFYAANLSANVSDAFSAGAGAGATVKSGKLITAANYSFNHKDRRQSFNSSLRKPDVSDNPVYSSEDTLKSDIGNSHTLTLNMSYDATRSDVLYANLEYANNSSFQTKDSRFGRIADGVETDILRKHTTGAFDNNTLKGDVTYQHFFDSPFMRSLSLQYNLDLNQNNTAYDISGISSDNRMHALGNTLTLDYYHQVSPLFNYYVRGGYINRNYSSESLGTQLLDYNQNVGFVQGNVTYRINKIMLSAETTLDYTKDIKSYGNISYQARMTYPFLPGHMLMLTSAYSIYRPSANNLNSYEDSSVAGSISGGNGSLDAQRTLQLLAIYRLFIGNKLNLSAMATYMHSGEGLYDIYSIKPEDGILSSTTLNTGASNNYRANLQANWNPAPFISLSGSYTIGLSSYEINSSTNSYWTHNIMLSANCSLWKGADLMAYAYWWNPDETLRIVPQVRVMHNRWVSYLSLTQQFKNGLSIYISTDQPWSEFQKDVRELALDGYTVVNTTLDPRTRVTVGLRWNFGSLTDYVKFNMRQYRSYDDVKQN